MERFGFTIPMLVAVDGTVTAGHGRLMAAAQLGFDEVPVMVARGWSEENRRLYTLADNRLAGTSDWNPGMLYLEVEELRADIGGDVLASIGFSDIDLRELIPAAILGAGKGTIEPDDIPELQADAITRTGDA